MRPKTNIKDRLSEDWGLACYRRGLHDPRSILREITDGGGVQILAEAQGPVGVLRAMEVRCGPIGLEDGEQMTIVAVRLKDGQVVADWWKVRQKPEPKRPKEPLSYARDYGPLYTHPGQRISTLKEQS